MKKMIKDLIDTYNNEACKACDFRNICTSSKAKGRVIDRWEPQEN
ncbi:hypothetical protein [Brassicibacter mesophilus]